MRYFCKTGMLIGLAIALGNEPVAATQPMYHVVNLEVNDLLKELARTQDVRILTSQKTRGKVRGVSLEGDVASMLNDLGDVLDLDWFHYNGVYYVSASEEATTRVIALNAISPQAAIEALKDAGLWQINHPISKTFENGVLILSGPPQLLALIESVVQFRQAVPAKAPDPGPMVKIRKAGKAKLVGIGAFAEDELTLDEIDPAKSE